MFALCEEQADQTKFEQLYRAYRQLMYYTAWSVLHDEGLAEDAVQQAFLRILSHLKNIPAVDCPQTKSFVVIIVKNIAINFYNARRRHAVLSLDELEDWTPDEADSPVGEVENREDFDRLSRLISGLPESYRSVLLLRFDNGYSTREIAQMLDLSEENVKKRIQRARRKLEEILGR